MRAIFSIFIIVSLYSCHQETEADRFNREINESIEKLNREIEEGNKTVDEKTKEALDKFEKEMLDSTGKIKINKIDPKTFSKEGYLNVSDSINLKLIIAAYDSSKVPLNGAKKNNKPVLKH